MTIREARVEHLTLRNVKPEAENISQSGGVLILGNAYGIMPYQEPLATALAERGLDSWWFAFSGQSGTEGSFSRASAVQDVSIAIDYIAQKQPNESLSIIAHCAGGLMALEYLRSRPQVSLPVKSLIIYGLLFNPSRRRPQAVPLFESSRVKTELTEDDWNYTPLQALPALTLPVLFCHAKDKINLARASEEEVDTAVEATPKAEVVWFDRGYDRDLTTLPEFVECYYAWLTKSLSISSEEKSHE